MAAVGFALATLAAPGVTPQGAAAPEPARVVFSRPRAVALAPHPGLVRPREKAAVAAVEGLPLYTFFPQAGRLARDLFLYNGTDVDTRGGSQSDFDCTAYTYDGHTGHDVLVRSFREVEIGVPVFAVLDGIVAAIHDGEPDRNSDGAPATSNFVALDHGGGHVTAYYHLARGSIGVAPGEAVVAGQQIGLTASSGTSTWPHLHFESQRDGRWYEPSAGPCRPGASQWRQQPLIARGFGVAELFLSAVPIPWQTQEDAAGGLDPSLRTGTLRLGSRAIWGRIDLQNLPGGSTLRARLLDPRRRVVADESTPLPYVALTRYDLQRFEIAASFDRAGTWSLELLVNDTLAAIAPIRVVKSGAPAGNRAPNRIRAVFASPPRAGEVATCEVDTSLVHEDPDYDLVRYLYRWQAGPRVVRTVTSAALADHLRRDLVRAGEQLTCRVTPHDGRRAGPAAVVRARLRP